MSRNDRSRITYVAIGPSSFASEDEGPVQMLERAGCRVVPNPYGRRLDEAEIIKLLEGVDGLVAGLEPLNAKVIASAPQLRAIARVGIGTANVDFDAAAAQGVKVSSTPEGPVDAVAEMTLAALLALCRRLVPANAALHRAEWVKEIGMGLRGARVLLIGYGRIGRRVATLLRVFGAELLVYDPFLDSSSDVDGVAVVQKLTDGLADADVVSLHASGTEVLIGQDEFDAMKRGALFLNSARGELVDEDALVRALESGKLSGAWLDAFWEEPYAGRLTRFDHVLLTPHVGTYTRQCRLSMESAAVRNLLRDLGVGP